ncbi:alpha/beta fold hydrolase [Sphingomonas sp. NBWT7]|uniref:alpha/beta fold hydrolase n=1 Tax=Sphingomonas sp. NBWT7 TaxID=2596913 RepID=UPI0016296309|nr:alpha/beta fold hydrolase [Sphingomonas sp. NBWT7]QNE32959.1 alpha/beta fold hydrolase [Sphingomonas sp. NBWT7]
MSRGTVVMLHALGASGRSWQDVVRHLGSDVICLAPDLPGFGNNAAGARAGVQATLDWLIDYLGSQPEAPTILVGHSMGGKFATLLAARAATGARVLRDLRALVLLAASPPAPEPMDEARRAEMIRWFACGKASPRDAAAFVTDNIAGPLADDRRAQAIEDVERTTPVAWIDWLENGSREDWRDRVGVLDVPTTIVAGAEDGDLGEPNQRRLNLPHFAHGSIEVIPGAAHLLPYEKPAEVADVIRQAFQRGRGDTRADA